MKAHQRVIKEEKMAGSASSQITFLDHPVCADLKTSVIREIDYLTASTIILEYEWIGTMPLPKSIRYMYGIYFDGVLGGVVVYVEPSTRQYYKKYPRKVVQLNRGATAHWTPKNTASRLIGQSKKLLKQNGVLAIVAFCTKEAGEIGTIYQACNFDYVGETKPSRVYFLDNHWVNERTIADKFKWASTKIQQWKDKFNNLPMKYLEGKYKYVLFIGNKYEKKKFMDEYRLIPRAYPRREE